MSLGAVSGPCGDMTKKVRQFPFRPVPAGRYRIRFTGTSFYDPQGFWIGYRDVMDADGSHPRRLTDNPARDESPDWQALPFDGRGHQACGDDSLASGGTSSVLAMGVPCHAARRIARRWAQAADAGTPRATVRGLTCSATQQPYDLTVVQCSSTHRKPCARDIGFVWRDPARAPAPAAAAPQALSAPEADSPPQEDPGDEGSAEAHEA